MGLAVMCDSRLQAILLLCAAVSVSAELLVEDPDGEDGKVDVQRGQMEPVMVEVQRPSREEPRVEGRMVKTMTSPSQVIRVLWDGLKGRMTAPPRPQVVNGPTMDSWKLNFRLKRGDLQRVSFPTYGAQYGYHLRKRSKNSNQKNDWIRLLKKQVDEPSGTIPVPQVLRLGKRNLKGIIPLRTDPYWLSWWKSGAQDSLQMQMQMQMLGKRNLKGIIPLRTDPYWLSWWKSGSEDQLQSKAMISEAETEARKKDMHKVLKALGAMLSEEEE